MSKQLGHKIIDMKAVEEQVKKKLGTEEEPFEGEVPIAKVEDAILEMIDGDVRANRKISYVFDGYIHKTVDDFCALLQRIGSPSCVIQAVCENATILARLKKKLEIEELSEEQQEEVNSQENNFAQAMNTFA
jgi:hypothetical protein